MIHVTPATLAALESPTITKKDYDKTLQEVSNVTNVIWRYICRESNRKLSWWAFSNDVDLGRGNGSTGGEFDPKRYSKFIDIIGESRILDSDNYPYNYGFETSLLTDPDWNITVDKALAQWRAEDKVDAAARKAASFHKKQANKRRTKACVI
jgi:hypothetical protein